MLQDILNNPFNNFYAVFFYWLPMALNAVAYTMIAWGRVQTDKAYTENWLAEVAKHKAEGKGYAPTLYDSNFITIGTLVGYALCTVVPLVNAIALVFDAGPDLVKRLFKRFEWLFEVKLVKAPTKE